MTIGHFPPDTSLDELHAHLNEAGYVVIENALPDELLARLRSTVDHLLACERAAPSVPGDGPSHPNDHEFEAFFRDSYTVSEAEVTRLMQRIRHTRASQAGTPWPVEACRVNKCFLHLPTMFDNDRSQRVWNLLNKCDDSAALVEHSTVLPLVQRVLGFDCVLSDCSATSIGPQTGGGAWHVDAPLGQLPEPLPDFAITTQNAWLLDDFTADNGATRIVPGSHATRRKPGWVAGEMPDEITLTAPAGSVAVWLSNTWHRSGPNTTDQPRRAILSYYCRSWVAPFTDFCSNADPTMVNRFSPAVRYLMGYSAKAPTRG